MPINYSELKNRLWHAADELRANSRLRSHEYSVPVLGLIFLRYADYEFGQVQKEHFKQSRMRIEIEKLRGAIRRKPLAA